LQLSLRLVPILFVVPVLASASHEYFIGPGGNSFGEEIGGSFF
jgi:hypothetical protein